MRIPPSFGSNQSRSSDTRIGRTEGSEEPPVLAAGVTLLKDLLDVLLGILALADLLEGVLGDNALETLKLESVAGGHQVVVVDDLDEGLDLGALLLSGLGHAAGDLAGVPLDAGDEGVAVGVGLGALVDRLDDDDLEERKIPSQSFARNHGIRPHMQFVPASHFPLKPLIVKNDRSRVVCFPRAVIRVDKKSCFLQSLPISSFLWRPRQKEGVSRR